MFGCGLASWCLKCLHLLADNRHAGASQTRTCAPRFSRAVRLPLTPASDMTMAAGFDLFSPFKYFNVAPSTDWQRFINPQFNVTINQSDVAIENSVLARAGSYGK